MEKKQKNNKIYVESGKRKSVVAYARNRTVGNLCQSIRSLDSILKYNTWLSDSEKDHLKSVILNIETFKNRLVKTKSSNVIIKEK
jgi:hypothetical protein